MKTEKNRQKTSKIAVVFYVLAAVMLVAAIFMMISAIMYVKVYIDSYGMSFGDMWSEMTQYIISGCVPYYAYAILIFGVGKLISLRSKDSICDTAPEEMSLGTADEHSEDEAAADEDTEEAKSQEESEENADNNDENINENKQESADENNIVK